MNLLLRNRQPPGDVLMLTAAVRDLQRACPGAHCVAVDTACPALWENNPLVTRPGDGWIPERVIDCEYPLIHEADHRPFHFIHGFCQDLERKLGVKIPPGAFRGDVYLSADEARRPSPVAENGHDGPYWVIVAGGKHDFTAKWWAPDHWQRVVDHFRGRIRFAQCGAAGDYHPPLDGVVDLVGKTGIRELIRTIYHADGVLCPVTFAMHLAAAVPARPGVSALRPCVVVAGGREPAHWEMYPGHQFLHTVGALDCCAAGGCWKSRCTPIGDADPADADLCTRPVTVADRLQVGQCMTLITPSRVIDAISLYYQGGILRTPSVTDPLCTRSAPADPFEPPLNRPAPTPTRAKTTPHRPPLAVTIGVAGYAQIAQLAAKELHNRTGLPTVVLDDRAFADSGLEHPTFLKFRLFDLLDADDLLFFDADMVCLEDWDPAPLFGSDRIVAVRDRMIPLIVRESAEWSVPPAEHFNTGLLVINRRHHAAWLRRAEALRFARPTALCEQLPLNAARCELGIPLRLLDRRHNWIGFGASSLSHDVPVLMAHRLAPGRQALAVDYFKGEYELFAPRLVPDDAAAEPLKGRTFTFHDGDGNARTVRLREDGTLMPPADPDAEGYWFVHTLRGRPTLALASETAITHQFVQVLNGTWVGLSPGGHVDPSTEGPRLIDESAPIPTPGRAPPAPGLQHGRDARVTDGATRDTGVPPVPAIQGTSTDADEKRNCRVPEESRTISLGESISGLTETDSTAPVLTEQTARPAADAFVAAVPPYPSGRFQGRGIVVCGGGDKYFPCAYVCLRMLRHVGCTLPVELWHVGPDELRDGQRALVEPLGVRCVDAARVRQHHPVRALTGWPLKPYAILHSAFEEVMLIDADNVAVRDPAYLFDAPPYRAAGALFWPDFQRLAPDRSIWRVCGVPYRDEPEVESGQLLVDKSRCWLPLQLTMHLNEHGDFYYHYVHGDKETFHMAWRMLARDYAMVPHPLHPLEGTMCQHDFEGRRVFQHRNMLKWKLNGENKRVKGFEFEDECLRFLGELSEGRTTRDNERGPTRAHAEAKHAR